jgi:hypothetical protein
MPVVHAIEIESTNLLQFHILFACPLSGFQELKELSAFKWQAPKERKTVKAQLKRAFSYFQFKALLATNS